MKRGNAGIIATIKTSFNIKCPISPPCAKTPTFVQVSARSWQKTAAMRESSSVLITGYV